MSESASASSAPPLPDASPRGAALMWFGVFAGPIAWIVDIGISYPLVQWECGAHSTVLLHLMSLIGLFIALAGCGASFVTWSSLPDAVPPETKRSLGRARFVALFGLALSAGFVLVIIANAIPRFFIGPCQQ
jgi:hypothetical protein